MNTFSRIVFSKTSRFLMKYYLFLVNLMGYITNIDIKAVVSNRKREIKLNKSRLIINAPRVEVTNENYKLLQVLDLLTEFEKYSEYDLKQVELKLLSYISNIKLSYGELERIVEAYPLTAQVKFYKIGGANVITQR